MAEAEISDNFAKMVAHTIHSLTVEDIRYFFKSDATEENGIPTSMTRKILIIALKRIFLPYLRRLQKLPFHSDFLYNFFPVSFSPGNSLIIFWHQQQSQALSKALVPVKYPLSPPNTVSNPQSRSQNHIHAPFQPMWLLLFATKIRPKIGLILCIIGSANFRASVIALWWAQFLSQSKSKHHH